VVKRSHARIWFYAVVTAVVLVVWLTQGPGSFFSTQSATPTQWQQMGVSIASETARLLTTLGTALLGALGLLMSDRRVAKPKHLSAAFACAMSTGLSLYYGYVVHLRLLWMLSNKAFDATSAFFVTPSHYQFYALLAAGFFFADFAAHNLGEET
jgi:succinate dehydrogenase hydrophobic anchor subunit